MKKNQKSNFAVPLLSTLAIAAIFALPALALADNYFEEPISNNQDFSEPISNNSYYNDNTSDNSYYNEPISNNTYIQEPISNNTYIPEPISNNVYYGEQISDNTYIQEPISNNTYIPEPISNNAYYNEPISNNTYIQEPISNNYNEPISNNNYYQESNLLYSNSSLNYGTDYLIPGTSIYPYGSTISYGSQINYGNSGISNVSPNYYNQQQIHNNSNIYTNTNTYTNTNLNYSTSTYYNNQVTYQYPTTYPVTYPNVVYPTTYTPNNYYPNQNYNPNQVLAYNNTPDLSSVYLSNIPATGIGDIFKVMAFFSTLFSWSGLITYLVIKKKLLSSVVLSAIMVQPQNQMKIDNALNVSVDERDLDRIYDLARNNKILLSTDAAAKILKSERFGKINSEQLIKQFAKEDWVTVGESQIN